MNERKVSLNSVRKYQVGYYNQNDYSAFYDRMVFPIFDQYGEYISMQGRAMYDWTKETTHPRDKKYYHGTIENKGRLLYGLYENAKEIVKRDSVVIVEGPFDVIALDQSRIPSVAILGTALTEEHGYLLRKYCKTAYIWMDSDKAGQTAATRIAHVLEKSDMAYVNIFKEDLKDPADYYAERGSRGVVEVLRG